MKSRCSVGIGTSLLVLVTMALGHPGLAEGQVYLEPGVGIRTYSADAGDLLGVGLVFSGLIGYEVSDLISVEGKIDLGIHGPGSELDLVIDNGLSLSFGSGLMLTPLKRAEEQNLSLGVGAYFDRTAIAWNYTPDGEYFFGEESDGLGAWAFEFGGYLGIAVSPSVDLKGRLSYGIHIWDSETVEGYGADDFEGNALTALGSIAVRF